MISELYMRAQGVGKVSLGRRRAYGNFDSLGWPGWPGWPGWLGWAGMGRDGPGWAGMGRDGPGWAGIGPADAIGHGDQSHCSIPLLSTLTQPLRPHEKLRDRYIPATSQASSAR